MDGTLGSVTKWRAVGNSAGFWFQIPVRNTLYVQEGYTELRYVCKMSMVIA